MASLSFKEATLGAYGLKANNIALLLQHPAAYPHDRCISEACR
jgi:hypothetical protein